MITRSATSVARRQARVFSSLAQLVYQHPVSIKSAKRRKERCSPSLSNRLVIQRLRLGMIVGVLRRQECGASNRVFEQRRRGLAIVGDDLL